MPSIDVPDKKMFFTVTVSSDSVWSSLFNLSITLEQQQDQRRGKLVFLNASPSRSNRFDLAALPNSYLIYHIHPLYNLSSIRGWVRLLSCRTYH